MFALKGVLCLESVVQLAGELFKRGYVALGNNLRAFEAVVVPVPPVADFEAFIAALYAMPGIAPAVVSAPSHVHFGAGDK